MPNPPNPDVVTQIRGEAEAELARVRGEEDTGQTANAPADSPLIGPFPPPPGRIEPELKNRPPIGGGIESSPNPPMFRLTAKNLHCTIGTCC